MDVKKVTLGKVNLNLINLEGLKNVDFAPLSSDEIAKTVEMTKEEKELYEIIHNCSKREYRGVIDDKCTYYLLYHLSPLRTNAVRWLPIGRNESVLETEAECGAMTEGLMYMTEDVCTTTVSASEAFIQAERFSGNPSFNVYSGDTLSTLECIRDEGRTFDWIILKNAGLTETAKPLLNASGHIVIISDNRMGLKYLSGVKPEGADRYFETVEGECRELNAITYSGLKTVLENAGLERESKIYYAYPDWRFMKSVYSDEHLPAKGELVDNLRNLETDRVVTFSEKAAFDASLMDGSFKYFSNAYITVTGNAPETEYARFSNERADEHSIYTTIEKRNGLEHVRKYPFGPEALGHIKALPARCQALKKRYEGSLLKINDCIVISTDNESAASFEYINGRPLSDLMDERLSAGDTEGFYKLFDRFVTLVGYGWENAAISDIDVAFSNIIVDDKGTWNLIDYEWCKDGSLPIKESAYRSIYCYLLEEPSRKIINLDLIREKLVLSKAASDEIEADEAVFQKAVTGRNKTLGELRECMGRKAVDPIPYAERMETFNREYVFQVYPSDGAGSFSEETSFFIADAFKSEKTAEAVLSVNPGDIKLRIDPINYPCIVTVKACSINEADFPVEDKKRLWSNGKRINDDSFVFDTFDPNMVFELSGLVREENSLMYVRFEITKLSPEVAAALSAKSGLGFHFRK